MSPVIVQAHLTGLFKHVYEAPENDPNKLNDKNWKEKAIKYLKETKKLKNDGLINFIATEFVIKIKNKQTK